MSEGGAGGGRGPLVGGAYLDPAVAPVGHDDVAVVVDGDAGGGVELAVSFAVGAELEEQLAVRGEHLRGRQAWGGRGLTRPWAGLWSGRALTRQWAGLDLP